MAHTDAARRAAVVADRARIKAVFAARRVEIIRADLDHAIAEAERTEAVAERAEAEANVVRAAGGDA